MPFINTKQTHELITADGGADGYVTVASNTEYYPGARCWLSNPGFKASGTLTAAAVIAGDTATINGVVFTGVAGAATPGNPEFSVDTGNNAVAASLAAQINAYAPFAGIVTASNLNAVCTVQAAVAGVAGNSIGLLGTAVRLVASGSGTLSGGVDEARKAYVVTGVKSTDKVGLREILDWDDNLKRGPQYVRSDLSAWKQANATLIDQERSTVRVEDSTASVKVSRISS